MSLDPGASVHTLERVLLPNGITLITVHNPGLHHAAVQVTVPAGVAADPKGKDGLSHFHEHMVFRGTERHPTSHDLSMVMDDLLLDSNAWTSRTKEAFHVSGPTQTLEQMCLHVSEMVSKPVFEGLETEREVVLQEYRGYLDPVGKIREPQTLLLQGMLGTNGFTREVIGDEKTIKNLTREDLLTHHFRIMNPQVMVVAVVSRETHEAMRAMATPYFDGIVARSYRASLPIPSRQPSKPRIWTTGLPSAVLSVGFPTPVRGSPSAPALAVIRNILTSGMSSRLWEAVRSQDGLCYGIDSYTDFFPFTGYISFNCDVDHVNVPTAGTRILGTLGTLVAGGPLPEELDRAKRRAVFNAESAEESAAWLAGFYTDEEMDGSRRSLQGTVADQEAVTAEDVVRVARETFDPDNLYLSTVATLKGNGKKTFLALVDEYRETWGAAF